MNSKFKNIFSTILIYLGLTIMIGYLILSQLCKIGVKCENCNDTSISKENSVKDGFYLMDYKPLQKIVKLKYHDETIEFNDVWIESQWFHNTNNCLNTHKEKDDGINVIFEFKKSNDNTFLFTLSSLVNGRIAGVGISEDRKVIRLSTLPDTIWLKIHEKNPIDSIGWKQEVEGDVIGFVKK